MMMDKHIDTIHVIAHNTLAFDDEFKAPPSGQALKVGHNHCISWVI